MTILSLKSGNKSLQKKLQFKRHIVGILICAFIVVALMFVSLVLALSDFHPGSSGETQEQANYTARIGMILLYFFLAIPFLLTFAFNAQSPLPMFLTVVWVVVPVVYGTCLYLIYRMIHHRVQVVFKRNNSKETTSLTGCEKSPD